MEQHFWNGEGVTPMGSAVSFSRPPQPGGGNSAVTGHADDSDGPRVPRRRRGRLLGPGRLTAQPVPGPGEELVGLPVKPGHLPARGLSPGDLVQVTTVPGGAGTDASPSPASTVVPFRARVLDVGPPDPTGAVTVDVLVGADAAQAATGAAAGQVVLVQLGPGT